MRSSLLVTIVVAVLVTLAVLVITLVVTLSDPEPPSGHAYYRQHIIDNINTNNINASLRFFTLEPHPAGSPVDEHLAQYIHTTWGMHGLKTHLIKYELFLATANADMPNKVILNGTDGEVFESSPVQPAVDVPSAGQQEIYSFNSFCGVGVAQSSSVVYANYGRDKDFHFLSENNVTVNNSIVFIRYGKLFRGDKVRFAESRGAAAVVLYTDPADAAPLGPLDTYPSTVFAPPGATQLGSLKLQGDLLTPGYPAVESAFRLPESEADLFSIPVQPMGYGDAWHFLSLLEGKEAPPTWQGDLNLTYHLGPQLAGGAQVTVVVNDQHHRKTVYNVLGIIEGQEEPDRYVVVGNHYDAWTYGGVDPSSATAVVMELVRVFGEMHSSGWRPRRTLVFCSWAAEEYGVMGSTEFAEQFSTILKDRGVVYLNMDMVMDGNYSFGAMAVPMLHDVIFEMAKLVPNPDPDEVAEGRDSLYDTWLHRYPSQSSGDSAPLPTVAPLGTGSDFRAFLFNLGIPSMDLVFTSAPGEPGLPLYHTAYETYFLTTSLMDQGLLYHQALARMLGLLAHEFSTQPILPYNVATYTNFISASWGELCLSHGPQLAHFNVSTEALEAALEELVSAGKAFQERRSYFTNADELTARRYNDAMLLLDKALLAPLGLPGRPLLNHILLAPSSLNGYIWDTFPGVRDLLRAGQQGDSEDTTTSRLLAEHVAALTHHLTLAARTLAPSPW
ncbi:putative N-acetylated-alpha-linked acidic dipeptidase [Portunus trituberculatus]|uniref:putative N-acetylated-alpha-linked acidic dipeptidase n=1 Tax=Portunus trituberculatus TaxID=210409 RepID=UPI001E1D1A3F|nr:putative N-acetylated-alpha-linked acidic dipeptidase [Portunus trituberculatus]